MLDFHLHPARLPHPEKLIGASKAAGYGIVAIACEPWEWEAVAAMDTDNKAFGIHPMVAAQVSEDDFKKLESYLRGNPVASVGECGLDRRYPGYGADGMQESVFMRQVELARDLRRDLQIHCVGDYGRIVALLKAAHFKNRPIFHRFGGDAGVVRAALPMGAIFSLHADSFKKKSTLAALPLIPAENVRFETDADETTFAGNGWGAENGDTPADYSVEQVIQSLKERWLATKSLWDNLKA